jgi:hypothetical protein
MDYVRKNLQLGLGFYHIPQLEDYLVDCIHEFEVRIRSWMRLSLRKIRIFGLEFDVHGIKYDESNLVDPIFINHIFDQPIPIMDWSFKEHVTIEAKMKPILKRKKEWVAKKKIKQKNILKPIHRILNLLVGIINLL